MNRHTKSVRLLLTAAGIAVAAGTMPATASAQDAE